MNKGVANHAFSEPLKKTTRGTKQYQVGVKKPFQAKMNVIAPIVVIGYL
jgi:hypothetical protein